MTKSHRILEIDELLDPSYNAYVSNNDALYYGGVIPEQLKGRMSNVSARIGEEYIELTNAIRTAHKATDPWQYVLECVRKNKPIEVNL